MESALLPGCSVVQCSDHLPLVLGRHLNINAMYFVVLYPSISQIIAFDHFQRSSKRGGSQGVTIAKRGHGPTTVDTSNTAFNITDDQCHPKLCACLSTMTYVR